MNCFYKNYRKIPLLESGGTLENVETAGKQLLSCVRQAGAREKTQVHCVGDGAPWIAHQVEEQFGTKGRYLIDFYHLASSWIIERLWNKGSLLVLER